MEVAKFTDKEVIEKLSEFLKSKGVYGKINERMGYDVEIIYMAEIVDVDKLFKIDEDSVENEITKNLIKNVKMRCKTIEKILEYLKNNKNIGLSDMMEYFAKNKMEHIDNSFFGIIEFMKLPNIIQTVLDNLIEEEFIKIEDGKIRVLKELPDIKDILLRSSHVIRGNLDVDRIDYSIIDKCLKIKPISEFDVYVDFVFDVEYIRDDMDFKNIKRGLCKIYEDKEEIDNIISKLKIYKIIQDEIITTAKKDKIRFRVIQKVMDNLLNKDDVTILVNHEILEDMIRNLEKYGVLKIKGSKIKVIK